MKLHFLGFLQIRSHKCFFENIRIGVFKISLLNFDMFLIDIVQSQYDKLAEDLTKRVAQKIRVEYHQNSFNGNIKGNAFNEYGNY